MIVNLTGAAIRTNATQSIRNTKNAIIPLRNLVRTCFFPGNGANVVSAEFLGLLLVCSYPSGFVLTVSCSAGVGLTSLVCPVCTSSVSGVVGTDSSG